MAYDESLATRVRARLQGEPAVDERRMFGGLAFMIGGHMAVVASGQGGLMLRVDPAEAVQLIASGSARPAEMRGRPMTGWLRLDSAEVDDDHDLERWLDRSLTLARSLSPRR